MNTVSVTPDALSQLHHGVEQLAASIIVPHGAVGALAPLGLGLGPIGADFLAALQETTTRHTMSVAEHGRQLALVAAAVAASRRGYEVTDHTAATGIGRAEGNAA